MDSHTITSPNKATKKTNESNDEHPLKIPNKIYKPNEQSFPSISTKKLIDDAIAKRSGGGRCCAPGSVSKYYSTGVVLPGGKYEYRDHTADIQLHSWGVDLSEALEWCAVAMFGYMTCLDTVDIDEGASDEHGKDLEARGDDFYSMVFTFLDEWLFNFHDTGFIAKKVTVTSLNLDEYCIKSEGKGEYFDLEKHPQGTEVKAITYSNMKVLEENGRCDVWVIIDI